MKIQIHDRLGQPLELPATRVLISLDDGTPIGLAVELQPGHIRLFRASDKDFQSQLRHHGIDRTVVVTSFNPAPPK